MDDNLVLGKDRYVDGEGKVQCDGCGSMLLKSDFNVKASGGRRYLARFCKECEYDRRRGAFHTGARQRVKLEIRFPEEPIYVKRGDVFVRIKGLEYIMAEVPTAGMTGAEVEEMKTRVTENDKERVRILRARDKGMEGMEKIE